MTVPSAAPQRANNFDLLRIVAATVVVYGHAFPLTGLGSPMFLSNQVQSVGVKIFFVISGLLITISWNSDPNVLRFAARRALRILPGLALVVAFTAFVLGPICTTLPLRSYFSNHHVYWYLENFFLYIRYDLPGVFQSNPYPGAVNGSLWSLPVEVSMYVLVPCVLSLGVLLKNRRAALWVAAVAVTGSGLYFAHYHPPATRWVYYGTDMMSLLDVAPYFLFGALYAEHGWHKKLNHQVALLVLVVCVLFPTTKPLTEEMMLMLALPYVVIAIGFAEPAVFASAGRYGDFSYGLYLYAFPIQQGVMSFAGRNIPTKANFIIGMAVTIPFALVSWHLVEKRAMRLRPRGRSVAAVAAG